MGAGRIFSRQGPNWIFQGQWCRRQGCRGWTCTPNVLTCWNPAKIHENQGKNGTQRCLTSKNGAQRLQKNTWILFLEVTPIKGFFWKNFSGKSRTRHFGQFWSLRAKIFRKPKNLPAPTLMSRVWPKLSLQGGQKVAKFHFHHSKLRKQLFLQKIWWENVKFQNSGGPCPPLRPDAPKTLYNKKAEENNKNTFTNNHMIKFENNSHWYLFFILVFEPDTNFTEHKHTLSAQHKMIIIMYTERFVTALVVGLQDYRHLLANL